MNLEQLKTRIESLAPGTEVQVKDLTGTENHYEASIVSPAFQDKSLIEQHQMVYALLKAEMATGEVHALSLNTKAKS